MLTAMRFVSNNGILSARDLAGRKKLAVLLVLAVLLCHGAFGALHQYASLAGPAATGGAHGHSAQTYPAAWEEAGGAADEGPGDLAYAAVLFFILGAVLWLRPGRGLGRCLPKVFPSVRSHLSPVFSPCPRGPTAPRLQVFLL